jgi:hypothetical protein
MKKFSLSKGTMHGGIYRSQLKSMAPNKKHPCKVTMMMRVIMITAVAWESVATSTYARVDDSNDD